MQIRTIAIMGGIALVMVLVVAVFVQLQTIILSGLCLALITAGLLMCPLGSRSIGLTLRPGLEISGAGKEFRLRIQGCEISPAGRPVELDFRLRTRNLVPLMAVAAVCTASLYVGLVRVGAFSFLDMERDSRGIAFWILGYACYALLIPALRWFQERLLLSSAVMTLGEVLGQSPARFGGTEIAYQFRTDADRAGGTDRNFGTVQPSDNAVPVLFSPTAPDFSIPGCGFWFHKVELISTGGSVVRNAAVSA